MEAKKKRVIIESEKTETIVYNYTPKVLDLQISVEGQDFIDSEMSGMAGEFEISDLAAKQAGITRVQRDRINREVEALALEKLKAIQEDAYREAYELGIVEGTEKAFKELHDDFVARLEKLDEMLDTMDNIKSRMMDHNEVFFVDLLHKIAARIACREISIDKEPFIEMVKSLIGDLHGEERIVLRLSGEDLMFLESLRERSGKIAQDFANIRIEAEEDVSSGGCILETNYGMIDATVEQRIDKVWKALEAKLPKVDSEERKLKSVPGLKGDPDDGTDGIKEDSELTSEDSDPADDSGSEGA